MYNFTGVRLGVEVTEENISVCSTIMITNVRQKYVCLAWRRVSAQGGEVRRQVGKMIEAMRCQGSGSGLHLTNQSLNKCNLFTSKIKVSIGVCILIPLLLYQKEQSPEIPFKIYTRADTISHTLNVISCY